MFGFRGLGRPYRLQGNESQLKPSLERYLNGSLERYLNGSKVDG